MKPFPHLLLLISSFAILHSSFSQTTGDPNEGLMIEAGVMPEDFVVKWYGKPGRSYFVQTSETLLPGSWVYVPVIEAGAGAVTQWGYANTSGRSFVRLRYTDAAYTGNVGNADFDADGLTNNAELATTMTDPLEGDVDDDGLNDGEEIALGTDPSNSDSDGDGLNDGAENTEGSDPNDSTSQPNLERWIQSERWSRNQYDTCTITDAGDDYTPATERFGFNRTTHLNGEWVNNEGYIFAATPFTLVIESFAPPTNWGTSSILPVIYSNYNAAEVIESTESYLTPDPPFESTLERRRWNATNKQVRLRTSVVLPYDYKINYEVFRDRRAALSEGPRTRTAVTPQVLTMSANSMTGPLLPFIYAPELGHDDIYVLKAIPEVNPRTISFGGATDEYLELKNDAGDVTYKAPHWYHANGNPEIAPGVPLLERNRPVAYVQGSTIKLKAKFRAKGFNWFSNGVHVRAKINGTLDLPDTHCTVGTDGYLTLPETAVTQPLGTTVKFYSAQESNSFNIAWEFYTDYIPVTLEPNWRSAGTTKHTVYVVKATPRTTAKTLMSETLFNIGCRKADGLTDNTAIVNAIYGEFTDRIVARVEPSKGILKDEAMTYWGDLSKQRFATQDLLSDADGRCGAWTRFFTDILRTQGIDAQVMGFFAPTIPAQNLSADIQTYLPTYNPVSAQIFPLSILYVKSWTLVSNPFNPVDNNGIAAQGRTDPQSWFTDHFLVQYGSTYYDPSYGSPVFNSQQEWEDAALDAFGAKITASPPLPGGVTQWIWQADPKGSAQTIPQTIAY